MRLRQPPKADAARPRKRGGRFSRSWRPQVPSPSNLACAVAARPSYAPSQKPRRTGYRWSGGNKGGHGDEPRWACATRAKERPALAATPPRAVSLRRRRGPFDRSLTRGVFGRGALGCRPSLPCTPAPNRGRSDRLFRRGDPHALSVPVCQKGFASRFDRAGSDRGPWGIREGAGEGAARQAEPAPGIVSIPEPEGT